MHKVMTRAHRLPARRDQRTPGTTTPPPPGASASAAATSSPPRASGSTAPPRIPGGGRRTPAADGRPPASGHAKRSRTRPADTRPPTLSGTRPAPRRTAHSSHSGSGETVTPASTPAYPDTTSRVPSPIPRRPLPRPLPTDLFADLLLAVLSGHRPVHSMLRHTRGRAYDELAWLAERGPLRTRGARPVVRDIGWCEPRPGAIEAFARIGAGDRLRAMAFRLELGQDLRWRCTAVELGGPRPPRAEAD
ncbi:Rv3235 family protein [Streptomyces sp. NRRL S-481]|uniref:Rv3235 family protein n=1 Tax=Streptomyces sp. NRRL S-481 TaxID=1463911 RepID=UPI00099D44B7|nr:Rv3235 family protein [Streptomyces sp. NRRL S-481]